jgi:hypothetical protein
MNTVEIDLTTFYALLKEIIAKSNEVLIEEEIIGPLQSLKLAKPWSRLFGSGKFHYKEIVENRVPAHLIKEYKSTVSYAMLQFFLKNPQHLEGIDIEVPGFGPRKLYDYHDQFRKLQQEKQIGATISVNENYLHFYLKFIEKKALSYLKSSRFYDRHAIKSDAHFFHYACHYYSIQKRDLTRFEAEVTTYATPNAPTKVFFYGDDLSQEYEGDITIRLNNREAVINAWTNNEEAHSRPLLVTLTQHESVPLHKRKIFVGLYLNAESNHLKNSSGLIVFERLHNKGEKSGLDAHHLIQYLIDPPQSISNGGFASINAFYAAIEKSSGRKTEIAQKLKNKYFLAFHMSKQRESEEEDRLEIAKFYFDGLYYFQCTNRNNDDEFIYEYAGRIKKALGNKLQLQMEFERDGTIESQYQIILEMPNDGSVTRLNGIYSGVTRTQHIDGGRVVLFLVKKAEFEQTTAGSFSIKGHLAQHWTAKLKLADFFGGLDNHLIDNVNAYTIFIGNNDFSNFHGVFNYYRTRTIKGKSFQVKRMPVWIKPNGDVEVKFIKRAPEAAENADQDKVSRAKGKAKIIDDCIFIHLKREERYDGLAILWPPSLDGRVNRRDEIIPALYVGHSKRFHIVGGKMYFDRVMSDLPADQLFESLVPENLDVDTLLNSPKVSHKVATIAKLLDGQLDNFIAIRNPKQIQRNFFGYSMFYASCHQAQKGLYKEACETLRICLLHTDFRDFVLLKAAFQQEGELVTIRQRFPQYCRTRFDQYHGTDQEQYLEHAFKQIF